MKLRYRPLDLADCLWHRGIVSELRLGRVAMPALNWYVDLASMNLYEVKHPLDRVLITFLPDDSGSVVAQYIANLQAARSKGLVA